MQEVRGLMGFAMLVSMLASCSQGGGEMPDANADVCPKQPYRHLEFPDYDAGGDGASYVSLATYCQTNCPASEADLIGRTTCRAVSLDASITYAASGVPIALRDHWARVEGCGFAQVRSPPGLGGVYYTFALDGGVLVCAGGYEDIPIQISGSSCEDHTFVAGMITPACPDASVLYCEGKR